MIARSLLHLLGAGATALLATISLSCDSDPVEPLGPGHVEGLLVSPHGAEGAAVLVLAAGDISTVEVDHGTAFVEADGTTTRLVLVLDDPGEIRFRVSVAERSEPPEATVIEVADGQNNLRNTPSTYSVEFTPVPDPVVSLTAQAP
jgi:hypothetical protein